MMSNFSLSLDVAEVLTRLRNISPDNGETIMRSLSSYKSDIYDMLEQGWTSDEVVSLLRLTEGVTPELDEDVACKRMAEITARVKLRLNGCTDGAGVL